MANYALLSAIKPGQVKSVEDFQEEGVTNRLKQVALQSAQNELAVQPQMLTQKITAGDQALRKGEMGIAEGETDRERKMMQDFAAYAGAIESSAKDDTTANSIYQTLKPKIQAMYPGEELPAAVTLNDLRLVKEAAISAESRFAKEQREQERNSLSTWQQAQIGMERERNEIMRDRPSGGITPYQQLVIDDRNEQRKEKGVENYAKLVDEDGFIDLLDATKRLRNNLGKYGETGDIPGYGGTAMVPEMMLSDPGKAMRQDVSSVANMILKARSGAAVTESEAGRLLSELGISIYPGGELKFSTRTDDQLRRGVGNVIGQLSKAKLRNYGTMYPPEVQELYKSRGGQVTPDYFSSPNEQASPPPSPGTSQSLAARAAGGMTDLPDPAQHQGRIIRDTSTGQRLRSDGQQWVPE